MPASDRRRGTRGHDGTTDAVSPTACLELSRELRGQAVGQRIRHHVDVGLHAMPGLRLTRIIRLLQLLELREVMGRMGRQQAHDRILRPIGIGTAQERGNLSRIRGQVLHRDVLPCGVACDRGIQILADRAVVGGQQREELLRRRLAVKGSMDPAICCALATTVCSAASRAGAFLSTVATATLRIETMWPSHRSRRSALVSVTLADLVGAAAAPDVAGVPPVVEQAALESTSKDRAQRRI